jgi:hypothetical protein
MPACEDLSVLHELAALPVRRDVISVIDLASIQPPYSPSVRWAINRAKRMGMVVKRNADYGPFMEVLTSLLKMKYQASPVHSLEEVNWLVSHFPENIQLQEIYLEGELMGGILLYITEQVVHAQYTAMTAAGKKYRALPYLVHALVQEFKDEKRFFSLGTSRDNEPLYKFKESLGARAMLQEQYVLEIS